MAIKQFIIFFFILFSNFFYINYCTFSNGFLNFFGISNYNMLNSNSTLERQLNEKTGIMEIVNRLSRSEFNDYKDCSGDLYNFFNLNFGKNNNISKDAKDKIYNELNNMILNINDPYKFKVFIDKNSPSFDQYLTGNKTRSEDFYIFYLKMNPDQKKIFHQKLNDGNLRSFIQNIKENLQIFTYVTVVSSCIYIAISFVSNFIKNASNNLLKPFFNRFTKHKAFLSKLNFEYITNYNLSNIAGYQNIKKIFMEVAQDLVDQKTNLSKMEGICLYGEPGNGKTQIIKALAGQSGVPLIIVNLNTLLNKNGKIEENINLLFEEVRKKAPCILLLDEFDLIAGSRKYGKLTNSENSILNELLQQLDGAKPLEGVLVVANTNIIDNIDSALTRPGRLGRIIEIGSPSEEDILEIILFYINEYDIKYENNTCKENFIKLIKNKFLQLTKINVSIIKEFIKKIKKYITKKKIIKIKESDCNDLILNAF